MEQRRVTAATAALERREATIADQMKALQDREQRLAEQRAAFAEDQPSPMSVRRSLQTKRPGRRREIVRVCQDRTPRLEECPAGESTTGRR